MGIEQRSVNEALDQYTLPDPHFGMRRQKSIPYEKMRIRFVTGCLADERFLNLANELLTKSLRCQGKLNKRGDIMVIEHKDTFDKEGFVHMLIKYIEFDPDEETVSSDADEEVSRV